MGNTLVRRRQISLFEILCSALDIHRNAIRFTREYRISNKELRISKLAASESGADLPMSVVGERAVQNRSVNVVCFSGSEFSKMIPPCIRMI